MGRNGALGAGVGFVIMMALGVLIVLHFPDTAVYQAVTFVIGVTFGFTGLMAGMLIGRRL